MRRLDECGIFWRDYLLANSEGAFNDVEDFVTRVDIIGDVLSDLPDAVFADTQDSELIKAIKEEVDFQCKMLGEMIGEFADYCEGRGADWMADDFCGCIMDELRREGTYSFFYEVALDWKDIGKQIADRWSRLDEDYGYGIGYLFDDASRLFMDAYMELEKAPS